MKHGCRALNWEPLYAAKMGSAECDNLGASAPLKYVELKHTKSQPFSQLVNLLTCWNPRVLILEFKMLCVLIMF